MPKPIVARLNESIREILLVPGVKTWLTAPGFDPVSDTSEQFAKCINEEITKWAKVIKKSEAKQD